MWMNAPNPMAAPTEVTEDEEVTLSYVVTVTTGRCCICATTAMHWPDMENPVPRTAVLVRMEKIRLLKFPVAQWYTMPKQANISVTSPSMDKK